MSGSPEAAGGGAVGAALSMAAEADSVLQGRVEVVTSSPVAVRGKLSGRSRTSPSRGR